MRIAKIVSHLNPDELKDKMLASKDRQQFHLRKVGKIKQIESRKEELSCTPESKKDGRDPFLTQRKNEISKKLTDIGVAPEMIVKLFAKAGIEEIERQIEWLPYRKSSNPAGILVSAIRSRWIMPVEYEREREKCHRSRT